jgi:hypothetical protein
MGAVAFTQLPASGRGGERMAWLLDFSEFDSAELRSIRGVRDEYERLREVLIGGGYAAADVVCEPALESAASEGPDSLLSFPGHASLSRRMTVSAERPALLLVVIVGTAVAADGRTMLCLRDSNPEDSKTMLSLEQLQQILSGDWNLADQTIVVLDVGRNPWFRGGPVNLLRDLQRLKAESASLRDRSKTAGNIFWISTCSSGERSIVSEGTGRGVYLDALTTALAGAADGYGGSRDGYVLLQELLQWSGAKTAAAAATITGSHQHCWSFGETRADLAVSRFSESVAATHFGTRVRSELSFEALAGSRLESNRAVSDCLEFLRFGEMTKMLERAREATALDPTNLQAWRLQMLAQLCAKNYSEALTASTQTGDELWLPITDSTLQLTVEGEDLITVFGGDLIWLGQLQNPRTVGIQGIRNGRTWQSVAVKASVPLSALERQKVSALDWVSSMALNLQLSPAVMCEFSVVYARQTERSRKINLRSLMSSPAFRP